jgi:hypothetical protein
MIFCKSKNDSESLYLHTQSKHFNIDWLYITAKISETNMKKFFSSSIQFSYRGLILNFILENGKTLHFNNRTRVTCNGIELLIIESFAHSGNVAFKQDDIRIRVSNSVFYTPYTIFILKALFSKQMLDTSIYKISELHIAYDGSNEIYNFIDSMVTKGANYSLAYLPKNDKGHGRKLDGRIFNIENSSFLSYTIGSKNNDLWLSCYNKATELKYSQKKYIIEYWKKNNIEYNDFKFYRFEIRLTGSELKKYCDITNLDTLKIENICNIYQTIFNERLQFKIHKKNTYKLKLQISNSFNLQKNKLTSELSDRMYKMYLGYWIAQYYKFSLNPIDGTGETNSLDYIFDQCYLMSNFLINISPSNILFIKQKFENITKEFPIKKLRKEIQTLKTMIEELVLSCKPNDYDYQ